MSPMLLAADILRELWRIGVREIVLCAGARNAPFVAQLSVENPFAVHPFFEERSGGFFALGRAVREVRPVAVITTSGTAAANLLPAAIEADYQGVPLILVTADRPAHYRGSGAPQTIHQVGIFSHYVEKSWDVSGEWSGKLEWSGRRPLHLNVCLSEPLLDRPAEPLRLDDPFREGGNSARAEFSFARPELNSPDSANADRIQFAFRKPLVIVGGLALADGEFVAKTLAGWGRPAVIEAPSNLRGHPLLKEIEILAPDKTLRRIEFDHVIRVGSVPTHRFWRDLETMNVGVTHFSRLSFSGLPRAREVQSLASLREAIWTKGEPEPWSAEERARDREFAARERELLKKHKNSEPACLEWLSRAIPQDARVFLGNSLPIREWDFAAVRDGRREIFANRGANGIDGLISTFLGVSSPQKSNWCVLGDLSAMYDLSGPWPNRREKMRDLNLVVINNSGGKIFHRLFRNPLFENPHDLNFKAWAEMWGWEYLRAETPRDLPLNRGPRVIEVIPDARETENFWKEWGELE